MGFGKCDCPLTYSPTLKACGCAVVGGWLAEGACGIDWVFCAHIPTVMVLPNVNNVKNLAVGLIVVSGMRSPYELVGLAVRIFESTVMTPVHSYWYAR
jgi:hypothetical protein